MRKKKKEIKEAIIETQPTSTTIITNATQSIGYIGEVAISIKRGKTVLSKEVVKNTGCYLMFKFIANALAGNYVSNNRPCKIRLFTNKTEGSDLDDFDESLAVSPYVLCNNAAVVTAQAASSTDPDKASVTYTFLIPYSIITNTVNKAALYSVSPSDPVEDRCAYITFETPYTILTGANAANTVLEIAWTVSVTNQTTTTTA